MNMTKRIRQGFLSIVMVCICLLSPFSRADSTNDALWIFPSTDLRHNLAVKADQTEQLLTIFAPLSPGVSNMMVGKTAQFANFLKGITNAAPLGKTLTNLTVGEFVDIASNEIQAVDNHRNVAKVLYSIAETIPLSLDTNTLEQSSPDANEWFNQSASRAMMQLALVADATAQAMANTNGTISLRDQRFLLIGLTNVLGSGGVAAIQNQQTAMPPNLRSTIGPLIQKFNEGDFPLSELTNFADAYYETVAERFVQMMQNRTLDVSLAKFLKGTTNRIDADDLANIQADWAEQTEETRNTTNGDSIHSESSRPAPEQFDDYLSSLEEREFLFRLTFEDLGVVDTNKDLAFQSTISLEPGKLRDMLERLYDEKIERELTNGIITPDGIATALLSKTNLQSTIQGDLKIFFDQATNETDAFVRINRHDFDLILVERCLPGSVLHKQKI